MNNLFTKNLCKKSVQTVMIQIGSREQHVHPKPVQKYGSHKQSVQKSVHPKPTIMIQISSFNSQKQSMQIFYIAKSNSQNFLHNKEQFPNKQSVRIFTHDKLSKFFHFVHHAKIF